jgi:internalin A
VLETNLATNRNLDKVVKQIKHRIQRLSHVGTPLPRSWVAVRERLELHDRDYIPVDDYYAICQECNLNDRSKKDTVIGFLHDLGVCLHFKNDSILKHFVILKPHWGTSAVYKVLDNKAVINNFGRFNRDQLEDIWADKSYDGMHDELLHLMMWFKLCYEIPGMVNTYIAPQLLSEDQPRYEWDEAHNLYLRYRYDFMPKGLVTRLIVAMQRYIDKNLVWKTGVILKGNKTWAEVIEHYQNSRIHIRVRGHDKKALLAVIMHELEEIHITYHGLKYDRLIPCNCEACVGQSEPYFFRYEVLQRSLEKTGQIQCQVSFDMVDARSLLDDLLPNKRELLSKGMLDPTLRNEKFWQALSPIAGIEKQQNVNIYGGTVIVEQNRNKSESEIHGNVQAGNVNIGGKQKFGDSAHIEVNISALEDAPQGSQLAELRQLLEQLQAELRNVPAEQAEDAEAVQDYANDAVAEATKEKPNGKKLEITGENLKKAAENLLSVAPTVAKIAAVLLQLR